MTDEGIIELFFARSEQAIAELDGSYGGLCRSLSRSILGSSRDAEECVNDSYLGMWNTVPPARPSPLRAYLCRIVRNLSLKRFHANTAVRRNGAYDAVLDELAGCLASDSGVEREAELRELTAAIEDFLDTLAKENRVIFLRRYWFCDTYSAVAERTGLSEKNISVRLTRIRRQLRGYLEERGLL